MLLRDVGALVINVDVIHTTIVRWLCTAFITARMTLLVQI